MPPKSVGAPSMEQQLFRNQYLLGTSCSKFKDHESRDALTAYYSERPTKEANLLPPLWTIQFYVTYGATAETEPELPLRLLSAVRKEMSEPHKLRLDVNFLPDANVDACVEHYRAERTSRLPARAPLWFVEHYHQDGSQFNTLFIVSSRDWPEEGVSSATFDLEGPDEYEPDHVIVETGIPTVSQETSIENYRRPLGSIIYDLTYSHGFEVARDLYDKALNGERETWSLPELEVSLPDTRES